MQRIIVLLLLVVCVGSLQAQQLDPQDALPQDPAVRTGQLPNGLRYYIRHNEKPEHRMELRLAIKAGSVLEDNDQQGLAHFCEHMEFNGTKHFPKLDLVNFLESSGVRFGAHLNAYTSFDQTVYMLQLPTDNATTVDKGLQVIRDWAGDATLESSEIDNERGVVLEEWRLGLSARDRISKIEIPVEYAGSRYADRLPIGKDSIIRYASYDALRRFYHTWYRPDLMAVFAVGDFDVDWMEKQIKDRFSPMTNPSPEQARTEYTINPPHDLRVSVAGDKEMTGNIVQVIFQRPQEKDKTIGDYRAGLVRSLYVEMLNNRLQESMRKPGGPWIFARASDGRDIGGINEFGMFAAMKPDMIMQGIRAELEELARIKQHGFTATELMRAKKDLLRGFEENYNERDKTESGQYISEYLRNYLDGESFPGISFENQIVQKYGSTISLDEVNALTAHLMTNAAPAVLGSFQKSDKIQMPSADDVRSLYQSVSNEKLSAYEDKVSDEPLMATKPTPGKIVSEKKIDDLGITEWTLSNGAKVVIKPTDFKNDEILFSAICPGGSSLLADSDELSAQFASAIVTESGVGKLDATSLEKHLAGKVVSLTPTISSLSEGFGGRTSPQDVETMFQLLDLYATKPRMDPDAYKEQLQKMEASLSTRSAAPESAFNDTLQVTLSQYNPRMRPMSVSRLQEVSLDKIKRIYSDRFSDFNGFTFFIVGNVKLPELRPLVETYVASLPSSGRKESWRDLGIRPPSGIIKKSVYKGIEPKSSVAMIFGGEFDYTPKNRYILQEMAEILGIKLRESLREEKGGVYGVSVIPTPIHYPVQRYQLTIRFGCAPDRVDELVSEVMRKLDTMTMKAPDETYLKKVKEIASKEFEVNLKTNNFWLGGLQQLYFNNEDPHVILERKQDIESLTAADILEASKKYCKATNLVQVILYPEKKQ